MTRQQAIAVAFVLSGLFLVAVGVAVYEATRPEPAPPTESIEVVGKKWKCDTHVNLASVSVTIRAADPANDAVQLAEGCSGYIGSIIVDTWQGDGIKMGFVRDLTIGSIDVHCYGHAEGKHQDGVQVQSAVNVRVDGGYVGCYSTNNSQVMIHTGSNEQQIPTGVFFDNLTYDPAGVDDPTGMPPHHYGPGGSYGVSNGASSDSGFTHIHYVSQANNHDLWQGAESTGAVWSCADVVAGTRANFDTAGTGCTP
jgi:hypothetical protein